VTPEQGPEKLPVERVMEGVGEDESAVVEERPEMTNI